MKSILLFLATTAIILGACEQQDNLPTQSQSDNYHLVITDSIQIDRMLSYPTIVSTNPENDNPLIMAWEGDQVLLLVMNKEGMIIQEFEYPKEGPKSAGFPIISADFFGDGYAILGYGHLVTYDKDFNVLKRIILPDITNLVLYSPSKNLRTINRNDSLYFLIIYGVETEKQVIEAAYYDEYNLLTIVDPENETFKAYGKFHEGSLYRSGRAFYRIRTFYEIVGENTKVLAGNDTVLYTFDHRGNEISRVVIPFDEYIPFKGYSIGTAGLAEQGKLGYSPGAVTSYLHSAGFDVITYRSGIKPERMEQFRNLSGEGYDRAAMNIANPEKVMILKDGKLVSDYLPLPKKILSLSASDASGNIWGSQNISALDQEPDVVTIYKMRIVEK